jgi:hypothetical protein
VNGQFSLSSCLKLLASQMGREDKVSHVMRNEMLYWLLSTSVRKKLL